MAVREKTQVTLGAERQLIGRQNRLRSAPDPRPLHLQLKISGLMVAQHINDCGSSTCRTGRKPYFDGATRTRSQA